MDPRKSEDLVKISNGNIAQYGYREEVQENTENGFEETFRTGIRRQRDKILYTGGFRRLQDKTQVMSSTISGDHRTRLTHTLEVEQIAVSIANALQLNTDLVSAIALGHDVGHTPFGHAAERKLNELLKDYGGFHHPIQSVKYLWGKYEDKIASVIYEGILLHDSDMFTIGEDEATGQLKFVKNGGEKLLREFFNKYPSTLEAQVVIWADKIAYITHDLEDFLRSKIFVNAKKSNTKLEENLCCILDELIDGKEIKDLKDFELRDLIRNLVTNLINSSCDNIGNFVNFEQTDVKRLTETNNESGDKSKIAYLDNLIINFDGKYRESYYDLRKLLDKAYILSPEVQRSDAKAQVIVEWLFNMLTSNYKLMPLNIRDDIDNTIICEFLKSNYINELNDRIDNIQDDLSELKKIIKELKDNYSEFNKNEDNTNENKMKYYNDFKKLCDKFSMQSHSEVDLQKVKEECNRIEKNVIYRKIAAYIATMSDSYAENLYRNLIGTKVDFIL